LGNSSEISKRHICSERRGGLATPLLPPSLLNPSVNPQIKRQINKGKNKTTRNPNKSALYLIYINIRQSFYFISSISGPDIKSKGGIYHEREKLFPSVEKFYLV
tara:strand:- start:462 stop:773 length:312 start_codon:yes stop_codon:yes gene_type:complete